MADHRRTTPDDWPESWWPDFDRMKAEHVAAGYHPGDAARLAYEAMKARAADRAAFDLIETEGEF